MPKTTKNLKMYEYDSAIDDPKNTAFNVQKMITDNLDKIDEFAGETYSHVSSKDNPHGVTCEQIGAAPKEHASSEGTYGRASNDIYGHVKLSDNSAASNVTADFGVAATPHAVATVYEKFKSHKEDFDNPHGVTCEQIGGLLASSLKPTVLDTFYPVGTVYQTTSSTFNPQVSWGGTWERIKDKFLLAAGDTYAGGSTGGEATHKLTVQEMPSHTHVMYVNNDGSASGWSPTSGDYLIKPDGVTTSKKNYQAKLAQNGAGLDQEHNNMPPYLAIYIWKRTA